jgi:hypothetical protein
MNVVSVREDRVCATTKIERVKSEVRARGILRYKVDVIVGKRQGKLNDVV